MSYQQGYPQQSQGFYQADHPQATRTNPATAVLAALLGLAAAAALVVLTVDFFSEMPSEVGFGDLPGELKTIVFLRIGAAAVLLIGAAIVFARKVAGAVILLIGALAALAAILLYPVLLSDLLPGVDFGEYLKDVFKFDGTQETFTAVTLILAPLALIFAILPPTLGHLRGSRTAAAAPQAPAQAYPQGW